MTVEGSGSLSGQTVLVTGASGFIGSHLCRSLHEQGAEIYAISRVPQSDDRSYIRWYQGDLGHIDTVRGLLGAIKPEVIFHLASHVAGSRDLTLVLPIFHSNLVSTVNLLVTSAQIGCRRIVLTGSLEEPASGPDAMPSSPYAAAKWSSSAYARMFHELYQTPVVIARLFMVYGPAQRDLRKLIPYVTLSLLQDQAPKLSSGHRQVDWIYVDDVVQGLLAMAQTPGIDGCTIDLGSGVLVPIRVVVQQLIELTGPHIKPLFGALPDRPREQVHMADTATAYKMLGWQPTTQLDKGLELTVNWYREHLRTALH